MKKWFVNQTYLPKMERYMKYGCVVLAIVFMNVCTNALPTASSVDGPETKLPPLIFPKENVTIGVELPPIIFPKENATVIGDAPLSAENATAIPPKEKLAEIPPLIFPKTNGTIPLVELPPLIFPNDNKTFTVIPPTNETALKILNSKGNSKPILSDLDKDYYSQNSSEDPSEEVEEIQPIDHNPQTNDLEENYKSEMNMLPLLPNELNDNTEVDHPMLKNTHMMGIIGAVLAALCACIYLGITIWRRVIFNRYGMRERLINEDEFYSNKSIHHNF